MKITINFSHIFFLFLISFFYPRVFVCVYVCGDICGFYWYKAEQCVWTARRPRDRIPVGERFSAPVYNGPGVRTASYTVGTGFFPGVKRPEHGVHHPPHLPQKLKKEYSYTSAPPSGPSWPVLGWPLPFRRNSTVCQRYVIRCVYIYIQGVPGGMDKTSGECSLCWTIPI